MEVVFFGIILVGILVSISEVGSNSIDGKRKLSMPDSNPQARARPRPFDCRPKLGRSRAPEGELRVGRQAYGAAWELCASIRTCRVMFNDGEHTDLHRYIDF